MCGIFGAAFRDGIAPRNEQIQSALDLLAHRGPDAQGVLVGSEFFLAHRRLSIIDLDSRSNQPMSREGLHISFNGEIYNYRILRDRLESKGVRFSTTSDTEVVLAAYREDGVDCLNYLEGMFAIAIWDERKGQLCLARDKFGEKPLYYYSDRGRVVFASELRPIEHLVGRSALTIDRQAMGLYFLFSYIPAPHSPYRDVSQLEPGHWLKVDVRNWKIEKRRYYKLEHRSVSSLSFDEATLETKRLVQQSVKERLSASDVPVAVFLSGGIDSSIVTGVAAQLSPAGVRAYSVSFPEDPLFDESQFARDVAQRYPNVRHTVIPVVERSLFEFTQRTLKQLSEPYADASLIPTAYLCAHVDEKVALSGDGADELFAGYGVYAAMQTSAKLPQWFKKLLLRFPNTANPHAIRFAPLRALALFRSHIALDPIDEYFSWRCYGSTSLLAALGLDTSALTSVRGRMENVQKGTLSDLLAADLEFNLPNDMLKKVDLASMFHSLEVRLPYLDSKLAKFALGQPAGYHIKGHTRKRLLRTAFADMLPASVLERRKQGFLLPIRRWFRAGALHDEITELIAQQTMFDAKLLRVVTHEHHVGSRDNSAFLWMLYVYLKWTEGRVG